MESERPRLLVTLRQRDATRRAVNELVPGVPWAFADPGETARWADVEAMLIGSLVRELENFDPRSTPRLRFVQRVYTGLDGMPFDRFPPDVAIAGNVGAFGPFVAEHALALALAAARDLYEARQMVLDGKLRPVPRQRSLYGATAVILGYGAIGQEIATRLAGFGTKVVGVNRDGRPREGAGTMYPADRMLEALGQGAMVFEVRPLTHRTAGTIDATALAHMRPDAVFVDVGRAGTVDEAALYEHLRAHPDFRAAFDVWWDEDYSKGTFTTRFPFATLPNFFGTPHSAGAVAGAEERALRFALENLARYFRDGHPRFVVDRAEYEG